MKWVGLAIGALIGSVLVATEFSVFAPIVGYGRDRSTSPTIDGEVEPAVQEKFTVFLDGRFDDLPKRIDDRITLSKVTMQALTLSFHFELHDPNSVSSVVALGGLEPKIRDNLCTDPRFLALAEHNAWAAFHVDDLSGLSLKRFKIDPASC
ncbi:MAG: hypothetical protein AAGC81_06550 [Pseudomonadota bacterium]